MAARAYAHHSQVAVYESTKTQTIEGKVAAVQIRSPHSWIQVEVNEKDENGKPLRYGIEWGSAAQLTRSGINGKTLKVGDLVKVTGRPGRDRGRSPPARHDDGATLGRLEVADRAGEVVD